MAMTLRFANGTMTVRCGNQEEMDLAASVLSIMAKEQEGWEGLRSGLYYAVYFKKTEGTATLKELKGVAERFGQVLRELAEISRTYELVVREVTISSSS